MKQLLKQPLEQPSGQPFGDAKQTKIRADAEAYLGALYTEGKGGVEQDFVLANQWFTKANDDKPDPEIQMLIGCFHLAGLGVKQDPAKARVWLEQAAKGSNAHGLKALQALQNGANVDHRKGVSFLEHLGICSPITQRQVEEKFRKV